MQHSILNGTALSNMPWEDRPVDCRSVVWRFSKNPVIGWNPTPSTARVFNSAVLPYKNEFIGVFRADHRNGTAYLHFGMSTNGIDFEIDDNVIPRQNIHCAETGRIAIYYGAADTYTAIAFCYIDEVI